MTGSNSALAYSPDAATGAAPALLAVRQVRLNDFRNYRQLRLDCGREPVVLVGPNGAGKTNLLEAISLFSPGRGLRGAAIAELGRRAPGETEGRAWSVSALLDGEVRLGTGVETPGAARRVVRVDGETVQPARLSEHLRLGRQLESVRRREAEVAGGAVGVQPHAGDVEGRRRTRLGTVGRCQRTERWRRRRWTRLGGRRVLGAQGWPGRGQASHGQNQGQGRPWPPVRGSMRHGVSSNCVYRCP